MNGFDAGVLLTLYELRTLTGVFFFIFITELGSTVVIGGTALCFGLYFLARKRISRFIGLAITIAGTAGVVFSLKEIVARARPDVFYQAYAETGFSFPSGHAAMSMALYGFIAYLAWSYLPERKRTIAVFALGLLIGLIGLSRLYLGLHFTSDVIAGYAIGAGFLALGIWASERLSRHSIWS